MFLRQMQAGKKVDLFHPSFVEFALYLKADKDKLRLTCKVVKQIEEATKFCVCTIVHSYVKMSHFGGPKLGSEKFS